VPGLSSRFSALLRDHLDGIIAQSPQNIKPKQRICAFNFWKMSTKLEIMNSLLKINIQFVAVEDCIAEKIARSDF